MTGKEEAQSDVLIMADRLARLYYWVTQHLIKHMGEDAAERFLKDVILDYGRETGILAKKEVLKQGLPATLDNYKYSRDLPSEGWQREIIESAPRKSVTSVSFCPFAHAWSGRYKGFEKWARIYCEVDMAKYHAYDPECTCECEKNLLEGDDVCIVKVSH